MKRASINFLLMIVILLSACQSAPEITATPTASNTITSTLSPSTTPTATATLTPTVTPTPSLPVAGGTPMPVNLQPITVQNAPRMDEIARYTEKNTVVWNAYHSYSTDPNVFEGSNYYILETDRGVHVFTSGGEKIADLPPTSVYCSFQFTSYPEIDKIFTGMNNRIAILTYGEVKVYDLSLPDFAQNPHPVYSLPMRTDVALGDYDGCADGGYHLSFSPDLMTVAVRYRNENDFFEKIEIYDIASGNLITTLLNAGYPLLFSPDGHYLVTNEMNKVYLWDAESWKKVKTYSFDGLFIANLGFSPDGAYLYTHPYGQAYTLIQFPDGSPVPLVNIPYNGGIVMFSKDHQNIAVQGGMQTEWQIFDLAKGRRTENVSELDMNLWENPFTGSTKLNGYPSIKGYEAPDSQTIIGSFRQNGDIVIARSSEIKYEYTSINKTEIKWTGDICQITFVGGEDCQTTDGPHSIQTISTDGHVYTAVGVSDILYEIHDEQGVTIATLHLNSGQELLWFMVPPGQDYLLFSLQMSDGDTSLRLSDLKGIPTWFGGDVWGRVITISPDGNLIGIASDDKVILLDPHTAQPVFTEYGRFSSLIAFTPDGKYFTYITEPITGNDNHGQSYRTIRVIEADTRKLKQTLRVDLSNNDISGIAFSPDGTMLALGLNDGSIMVLDAISGQQVTIWQGHYGFIEQLQFSPDGLSLLSIGGLDNLVKLWGVLP